jgi:protocatechuate 3,4-dioxygenase beta subunit
LGIDAQLDRGDTVTVTDPQGNPVTGAAVELLDSNTSLVGSAETGPDGSYTITNVPPGTYVAYFVPPDEIAFIRR